MTFEAFSTKRVKLTPETRHHLEGYKVEYQDGYVSWCPTHVRDRDYRSVAGDLTFGQAIEAMKSGDRVRRIGWNGKGIWLFRINGNSNFSDITYEHSPFIAMKTADNKIIPWLPSQTDMLSDDWKIATRE